MNQNEVPMQNERRKAQGWRNNAIPMQVNTNINCPKRTKTKSSTPSSPSLKWKANQNSVINSVLQSGSSSSRTCTTSTSNDSRVILALSEGRGEAACEVGIASIDLSQPKLILCQISDTQSYINTLTKINILNPIEIVIPNTFVSTYKTNRLVEKIKEHFEDVKLVPIIRSVFNKTNGMTIVKNLCIPNMNSVLLILQNRYYALAAASGLLSYIENVLNVIYTTHSLKIQYQESEGSTIIDITTADKLELVACAKQSLHKQYSNLYSIMNFCLTKIGARTLRASILQPPSTKAEIESRLDCVTELIERSGTGAAFTLRSLLTKIQSVDQLLNVVTLIPKQPQESSERQLNYLLLLNSFFEILEPLRECLREFEHPFYKQVAENLAQTKFDYIQSLIRTIIVEDARPAKGSNGSLQRCFAIKPGINSLLDLVRKSYSERLEEMRMYVKSLGEKYNLPLTLSNNNTKGYHIVLPLKKNEKRTFHRSMLPNEFIQIDRLSGSFTMKTTELINFSVRVEEIMMNILKISNIIIHKTLVTVKEHVSLFYKLCEDIAKLDMLQSLAKLSGDTNYVRPKFDDYMEIKNGRHPILDFICSETPVSNSIIATDDHNVHIISGPNGSGKSIFIRQLILIQVMAQVGCYVPAESATLRIADRILARISLDDNPDIGVSAFVLEILEVEYFLEAMSKNTLIIVDELCRSTSVEEGTALAMAICEKLAETPAFVFFTTHFKAMALLGDIYLNIKIWQMETIMEEKNGRVHFNFIYRLREGMTTLENYGVHMAKCCWPNEPTEYALNILKNSNTQEPDFPQNHKQNYDYLHLKYDLEADLRLLKHKGELFPNVLNDKLLKYQNSLKNYGESIQIHVDELKIQTQSIRPIQISEKSNSKESDCSETKGALEPQKTSSSSGYNVQYTARNSFGNSTPKNQNVYQTNESYNINEEENNFYQNENDQKPEIIQNESIDDYGDITFSGRPISLNSQNDNDDEVDIRNVTFDWKPSQDVAGNNNCYDYLGLYKNDSFQNDNFNSYFKPLENGQNYSLHPCPKVVLSSNIYNSDVINCDQTISELNEKTLGHQDFDDSNNSKRQFKIPIATKTSKRSEVQSKTDTSFSSVNEAQFSLPLAENRNKTSTPLHTTKTINNYCYDFVNSYNNLNNIEDSSFSEPKANKHDATYQYSENDYIERELNSYSEYFSDFDWEENNDQTYLKHNKKVALNRPTITININDSQKLNPQEMESIITDLESVSEYFSDDEEWSDKEPQNVTLTREHIPQTYCEEYEASSISYSPDESILQEMVEDKPIYPVCNDGDKNSGETLFKLEPKRKKIRVPFRRPKPFVKKSRRLKRGRDNIKNKKGLNDEKGLSDNKSSGTIQELEMQRDVKENDNKKIIVLQNIVIQPGTNLEIQPAMQTHMESNFNNDEFNEQKSPHQIDITDKPPIPTENETISLATGYIQSPKDCIADIEKAKEKALTMEKTKSLSSENFFKIETTTAKRHKLGIRQKRPKKSITETKANQKNDNNIDENKTPDTISNKNTEPENYNSSSHEIYHSANESFHELKRSFVCFNSSSTIEKNQSSSSITIQTENVKKTAVCSRILKKRKFISPLKLTKKEIKEEFEKQDRLMMESNCPEGYLQNILNRPSIRSIQQSECVAMIFRTSEGAKVITSPPNKKIKKRKLKTFLPPLIDKPIQPFDVTLFSDKNAEQFDKMMGIDRHNFSFNGSPFTLNVKKSEEIKETALQWEFNQQQTIDRNKSFTLDKMKTTENKQWFHLGKYFEEKEGSLSEYDSFLSFDDDNKEMQNTNKKLAEKTDVSDIDNIMKKYLNN